MKIVGCVSVDSFFYSPFIRIVRRTCSRKRTRSICLKPSGAYFKRKENDAQKKAKLTSENWNCLNVNKIWMNMNISEWIVRVWVYVCESKLAAFMLLLYVHIDRFCCYCILMVMVKVAEAVVTAFTAVVVVVSMSPIKWLGMAWHGMASNDARTAMAKCQNEKEQILNALSAFLCVCSFIWFDFLFVKEIIFGFVSLSFSFLVSSLILLPSCCFSFVFYFWYFRLKRERLMDLSLSPIKSFNGFDVRVQKKSPNNKIDWRIFHEKENILWF